MKPASQPNLFGSLKFKGIRECMGVEPAPSSGAFGEPKGHYTHTVRENSRTAYHSLDLNAREREVLAALEGIGRPATDREVMDLACQNMRVVMRFHDHPLVRELYPEKNVWTWHRLAGRDMHNKTTPEVLIATGEAS